MIRPTIICEPTGTRGNGWRFWCGYCQAHHHHGGQPDANGEIGHRGAHCHVQTSPYRLTGYILRAASQQASDAVTTCDA